MNLPEGACSRKYFFSMKHTLKVHKIHNSASWKGGLWKFDVTEQKYETEREHYLKKQKDMIHIRLENIWYHSEFFKNLSFKLSIDVSCQKSHFVDKFYWKFENGAKVWCLAAQNRLQNLDIM